MIAGKGQMEAASDLIEPGSARWWIQRAETERRRKPRAGGLTTARILEGARVVLDRGGAEALTLRNVADCLGCGIASLYRHIASRDEMLVLLVDYVLGDIRVERHGDGWRTDAEMLMNDYRRVLLDKQLLGITAIGNPVWGPNTLRLANAGLTIFLEAGLDTTNATYATTAAIQLVSGSAQIQRSGAGRGANGLPGSDGYLHVVADLPLDQRFALSAAGALFIAASPDELFANGLAILLDGVASRLALPSRL